MPRIPSPSIRLRRGGCGVVSMIVEEHYGVGVSEFVVGQRGVRVGVVVVEQCCS